MIALDRNDHGLAVGFTISVDEDLEQNIAFAVLLEARHRGVLDVGEPFYFEDGHAVRLVVTLDGHTDFSDAWNHTWRNIGDAEEINPDYVGALVRADPRLMRSKALARKIRAQIDA